MAGSKPMAVIIGSGLNALGVVRSLGLAKIPALVVCAERGPALHTRFAKKQLIDSTGGDSLIAALRHLGERSLEKPVLFLTEEKSVVSVSEHREEILPYFCITLPNHETLSALMHKQDFQRCALTLGSSIPQAVHLRGEADFSTLARLRYPCVLKPAVKNYDYGAKFQKAYVIQSSQEAEELFRMIAPTLSDLIVQEWIEGSDSDIYFCLQYIGANGKMVASFVGRKIRSWPPRIGGTASCTAAPEFQDELTATTELFFRQAGFVGMGSMEYKRDRRDGCFYMVEPTVGRTDFQEEVATVHGVNIPLAAYCYETGLEFPHTQALTESKQWREPVTDRWSAELQPEIMDVPKSTKVDAYWRLDDPMPWLDLTLGRIKGRLGHLVRRR